MQRSYRHRNGFFGRGTFPLAVVGGIVSAVFSACSSGVSVQRNEDAAVLDSVPSLYSVIFLIHGDGDYLFHDTEGNSYRADAEALREAITVAEKNPLAEVFIFHQRPERNVLLFFPLRDGELYHYRNGRLIARTLYWQDHEQSRLDPEVQLYHRFRQEHRTDRTSMFLCFGHELPEFGGVGESSVASDRSLTTHDLVEGLRGFTRGSSPFDLLVLSSCFGGTPHTIDRLGSYSRTIIASPENLHLSYFDLRSLHHMEKALRGDVPAFAKKFAAQAFERLTNTTRTTVSIAVYDVDQTAPYRDSVRAAYDSVLSVLRSNTAASMEKYERCDCAILPEYSLPTMSEGVEMYYRAPVFGKAKSTTRHSGWECWKELPETVSFIER